MEYGCIAEKLSHSFSPEIHKSLFGYSYELKELPRRELEEFLKRREFKGINVTIPYKEAVIPYLDEIDETAAEIGAVNTVVNDGGRLRGYNTDLYGMCKLIKRAGIAVEGRKVLVFGSGGTSKTAVAAARKLCCAEVLRVSRTGKDGCITYAEAAEKHSDAGILVNTTPCGMFPDIGRSAAEISLFPKAEGVVDAIYNPLRSKLVCDARKAGIKAVGGLYMLVAQAARAGEKFTGLPAPAAKIEETYRSILKAKQNIVLIGMPGSGKSTVGRMLAQRYGFTYIDTDSEIVSREGQSIRSIFENRGETAFRDIESSVIADVSRFQHTVISTGGGAVLRGINVDLLRENGRIYFLDRAPEHLAATPDRPLSSTREDLERRYAERYVVYCSSSDAVIREPETPEQAADMIGREFYYENTCD